MAMAEVMRLRRASQRYQAPSDEKVGEMLDSLAGARGVVWMSWRWDPDSDPLPGKVYYTLVLRPSRFESDGTETTVDIELSDEQKRRLLAGVNDVTSERDQERRTAAAAEAAQCRDQDS